MDSGRVTLEPGRWQDVLEFDGKVLTTVHGPRWRLLLIGAGQLTRYLARDGAHARLPRHGHRPARGVRSGLGRARRAARARHARRRGRASCNLDGAQRGGRADARSEARRPGADGGAQVAGVLRRRDRLEEEQRRAPRSGCASSTCRQDEIARLRGPVGPVHRLQDAARDRGRDPRRDDRGAPRRDRAELGGEARARASILRPAKSRPQKLERSSACCSPAGSATRFGSDKLRTRLPHGVPIAVQAARHLKPEVSTSPRRGAPGRGRTCRNLLKKKTARWWCARTPPRAWARASPARCAPRARPTATSSRSATCRSSARARSPRCATRSAGGAPLAAPYFRARRGHPVGIAGRFRDELVACAATRARSSCSPRTQRSLVKIPVGDPGVIRDIDTPGRPGAAASNLTDGRREGYRHREAAQRAVLFADVCDSTAIYESLGDTRRWR